MVFGDLETTSAVEENGKKVLTMAKYIEQEDLLELYRMDDPVLNENGHVPLPVIRQNIMDIPAADVSPVRHGHWISLTECANAGVYCSICKKKVWKSDYAWCSKRCRNKLQSNYCPNCGAKMDGELNE